MVAVDSWPAGTIGSRRAYELRSDESGGKPAADHDFWYQMLEDFELTSSGAIVTPKAALKVSAAQACIKVRGQTVATMTPVLYERTSSGRKRAFGESLYHVLHDEPNPLMSSFQYWELVQNHIDYRGNHFSKIQWNRDMSVRHLWPLDPDRMIVTVEKDWTVVYEYRGEDGRYRKMNPRDVFHVREMGDGLVGLSPVSQAAENIGLASAITQFMARTMRNNARQSMAIEIPPEMPNEVADNFIKLFNKQYGGFRNAGKTMFLRDGVSVKTLSFTPNDLSIINLGVHEVAEIARFFRMPLHKIQEMSSAKYSNVEHQNIEFVTDCILPALIRIASEINRKLIAPEERQKYYAEHLVENYLRGDLKSRAFWYRHGINWGWMSINEVRKCENLSPIEGGDVHYMPVNMMPVAA